MMRNVRKPLICHKFLNIPPPSNDLSGRIGALVGSQIAWALVGSQIALLIGRPTLRFHLAAQEV